MIHDCFSFEKQGLHFFIFELLLMRDEKGHVYCHLEIFYCLLCSTFGTEHNEKDATQMIRKTFSF